MWNLKGLWIDKVILKKNKVGGLILSDFKPFYKAISVILTKAVTQTSAQETPNINLHIYGQIIFKNIQWGKDHLFNIVSGKTRCSHAKKMKLDSYLIPFKKPKMDQCPKCMS